MVVQATYYAFLPENALVVKGHRNGGSSNEIALTMLVRLVVKGHRNGGSSNFSLAMYVFSFGCERPPKWWFKQLMEMWHEGTDQL